MPRKRTFKKGNTINYRKQTRRVRKKRYDNLPKRTRKQRAGVTVPIPSPRKMLNTVKVCSRGNMERCKRRFRGNSRMGRESRQGRRWRYGIKQGG